MISEIAISTLVKEFIKSVTESVITPNIKELAKKYGIAYKDLLIPRGEHFEEYLNRTYEKYSIINTLVSHNSQRKLKKIYVPLTLVKDNDGGKKKETRKINKLPESLIKKYKKILITDSAGMGKSTVMKFMFLDVIDKGLNVVGIPIYIELNRLNKDHSIISEIQDEMNSLSVKFDNKLLKEFIQMGGFIFFLDGYDEITTADKSKVTSDIQEFIDKAGTNNFYIMTSRSDSRLPSFGAFQSFHIKPFTKPDAFSLLMKYDKHHKGEKAKKIIDLLESGENRSINEFLENPLLVSLLYSAFNYKETIPLKTLKKHEFYGQVYESYFDYHDLSKGIGLRENNSGLNKDDFNKVLRFVGYYCLLKTGVKFDKETIKRVIEKAKAYYKCFNFSATSFLDDLLSCVPLFSKDGTEYKWVHKSILEYFAALFIANSKNEEQVRFFKYLFNEDNYENFPNYMNMLDLYYDIDYEGFSRNVKLPFCEQYLNLCNSHVKNISQDLIDKRAECIFCNRVLILSLTSNQTCGGDSSDSDINYETIADDLFNQYLQKQKRVRGYSGFTSTSYSLKNETIWMRRVYENISYSVILSLLYKKHDNFVLSKGPYSALALNMDYDSNIELKMEQNKVIVLDIETGKENEELYKLLNDLCSICMTSFYTNRNVCENEIKRIKNEIALSESILNC